MAATLFSSESPAGKILAYLQRHGEATSSGSKSYWASAPPLFANTSRIWRPRIW